jgi:ech hydrogenase subunit E
MPNGEIATPVKGNPTGEAIMRTEQPRGEVVYYVKGNGTKNLERLKIRTPTFANIPSLLLTLPGIKLADVPIVVLTIDPCISCTER